VLHTRLPVEPSSATTLPRNVQHSYDPLVAAIDSSLPDTATYSRPAFSLGEPVITDSGCSSARVFQIKAPVSTFSAYTFPQRSPKETAPAPIVGETRTPPTAANVQYTHPVAASSEYTVPSAEPTNILPPKTVGVPNALVAPGNPNAQLSFSFGVVCFVSPAWRVGWKRVFAASAQPFHSPLMRFGCDAGQCAAVSAYSGTQRHEDIKTQRRIRANIICLRVFVSFRLILLFNPDQTHDVERTLRDDDISIACRHHVSHDAPAGGNRPCLKLFRLGIEPHESIGFDRG